ncbi:VRR-NUC domain-containing protein [Mycena crocata]|nr:VRR-NUC domain-containing protein [Mycena crocata]
MSARPRRTILDLIFGADALDERDLDSEVEDRDPETGPEETPEGIKEWDRPSLYVKVIERAIANLMDDEAHLFTVEERDLFNTYGELEYHSRFILIRLVLRKPGAWHRLTSLQKYTSEVGPDGLLGAFLQLCKSLKPDEPMNVDDGDHEIIDLTGDSDDEDAITPAQPVAGPSNPQGGDDNERHLDYFCQGEKDLSLLEGLRILNLVELKNLCKGMKIQYTKLTKDQMITGLINHSSTQSVLPFESSPKSNAKGKGKARTTGLRQTILSFATAKASQVQTERLQNLMLGVIGKAIKVNSYIHTLMARVHIIWFRSTEYPTDSLFRPALFAGFKKLTFAEYAHVRDPDIWRTRQQYLDYEMALQVEATVDDLLKTEPRSQRVAKTPAPTSAAQFITPGTPGFDFVRSLTTPPRTPAVQDDEEQEPLNFDVIEDTPAQQKAKLVKKILDEHVLPKWKELVTAQSETQTARKPGLERFEPGFVYTRILRKCTHALATLKDFVYEKEVLDMMLMQRFWRRGRRARWYERRALLQMNYLCKNSEGKKDPNVFREARDGIIEALADADTVTVLRPALIRRLDSVEKTLKLPTEEKAKHDDINLQKPEEVFIEAIRIWDHPNSVKLDGNGKVKGKENKTTNPSITNYLVASPSAEGSERPSAPEAKKWSWTGKSVWQGKEGPVNVETRSLEYYGRRGFKGFHSETRVLTTLFGLLFWDIIFAQVPGAFETPWQTGPLDIAEDSFYLARKELIDNRLAAIKKGDGRTILEGNDERHREAKTCCIGVSWQMCGRDELVEIVECMGGNTLSSICQLFCEDYGGRSSGVPDLIVWNPETKECKFVEVKGPGDTLSENQKLWSDALLTAGCSVEICHVRDSNSKKTLKPKKTPKPKKASTACPSRAKKGKSRARSASVKSDTEDEIDIQLPAVIDLEADEDEWMPSTEDHDPPTPREPMRRRRAVDTDELPVFKSPLPSSTARKRRSEDSSASSSKKKKTS